MSYSELEDFDDNIVRRSSRYKKRPKLYSEEQIEYDIDKKIFKKIRRFEKSNTETIPTNVKNSLTDHSPRGSKKSPLKTQSINNETQPSNNNSSISTSYDMNTKRGISFDIEGIKKLRLEFPNTETYWKLFPPMNYINSKYPICIYQTITCKAPIVSISLSPAGDILALCTLLGNILIYSNFDDEANGGNNSESANNYRSSYKNWKYLGLLRDEKGIHVDEFYNLSFTPCGKHLFVAGTVKSRNQIDEITNELKTMPCTLIRFDLESLIFFKGHDQESLDPNDADIKDPLNFVPCVRYYGHLENITEFKLIFYKGENYILSCGLDGHIIKWKFDKKWKNEKKKSIIYDKHSLQVYSVSFLPNFCNRYFIAAVDDGLHLYDFEMNKLIQRWPGLYSSCCNQVKIVKERDGEGFYVITKGKDENTSSRKHEVRCYELIEPVIDTESINGSTEYKPWKLNLISRLSDTLHSFNHWSMRFSSNGSYLASPSSNGKVFIWNIQSGKLTGVLSDHERGTNVHKVLFHPHLPLLFTTGEDGNAIVYSYK